MPNAMRVWWIATILLALPLSVAAQAMPAPKEPGLIGFNNSPPLTYLTETGDPNGFLVSLAKGVLARMNLSPATGVYPATRLFKGLQDGTIQFSMLVKNPALEECCLFSSSPIITIAPPAATP